MDSYTEKVLPFKSSPSFLEKTIAHNGEINMGYLLQNFDEIAYVVGTKHLDIPSCLHRVPSHILTASVEHFHILHPITIQDIKISGHVVNVGTSSIEALVKAEIISCADKSLGTRMKLKDSTINRIAAPTPKTILIAKFNMVAVNIETAKAVKTNSLITTNLRERRTQELANETSTDGKPETSKGANNIGANAFDKKTRMFAGSNVRMYSLDEAKFHSKVNVGSTVKLTAQVIYSSEDDNMFQVKVVYSLSDCNGTFGGAEAMTANFTFLSLDKKIKNVVPMTLKENELYIEGE
ncbi:hypothetical protein J3Q64DRAFT_1865243 [Phycomyces blakesleeanus]|uniref:HotDog ACOT-type domain-containing protein n=1 Tax=Phycomyces blakesleeanus TaxID=4837 RepID=A0ABR3AWQ0_PHYBL